MDLLSSTSDASKGSASIVDSTQKFLMGTGSKRKGLYFFDEAKQTGEAFSISEHKTDSIGEISHLDVWGPYRITSKDGFRKTNTQSPNVSTLDVAARTKKTIESISITYEIDTFCNTSSRKDLGSEKYETETNALEGIQIIENNEHDYESEGEDIESFGHTFKSPDTTIGQSVRRTSRKTTMPSKYNDYVLSKGVKYSIDKVVNYSNLSYQNIIFFTSLNKIKELTSYSEGAKDSRKTNTQSPNVSTLDVAARTKKTIESISITYEIDTFCNTSSRKDLGSEKYETETNALEGIQIIENNEHDYESEGEDIESFGHTFKSPDTTIGQSVRRTSRKTTMPSKYNDYVLSKGVKYSIDKVVNYSNLSYQNIIFFTSLNKIKELTSYSEGAKDSRWVEAMNLEMEPFNRNRTWEVTDLPTDRKPIGSKWVFKVKYKSNGEVERFKAKLVAKGFNQRQSIDCKETFFPFGENDEDEYKTLPEGYSDKGDKRVCKLVKSLYELKQAPRKWNEKLTYVLLADGFVQNLNDFSLFIKNDKDVMLILLVYVDDIIVTGKSTNLNNFWEQNFLLKDLGKLMYFLGIEVWDTENGICQTRWKYCIELFFEFGMLGCKPCSTPIELNPDNKMVISKYGDDECLTGFTHYQKLFGKIIYLIVTRPDISYDVDCLSQVMHSPMKSNMRLAFRVRRYLKKEPGLGITFCKSRDTDIRVFVDSY
uniref:Ribonuclease H-like domain-containing protein n=1 Tax=Tanacetum cinerariifolium TaxID=118510 RepID=A0A6L2NV79_TANCI|nr:ribonuclease H-like domain-containing protein [Tanacetum cinerariifolium]